MNSIKILRTYFVALSFTCMGCGALIGRLAYGIKKPKLRSDSYYSNSLNKILNVNKPLLPYISVKLKTSYFDMFEAAMDSNDFSAKSYIQPLQALYFDTSGKLSSVLVNCYSLPKGTLLNWNDSNRLLTFPPKSHIPPSKDIRFDYLEKYMAPLNGDTTDHEKFIGVGKCNFVCIFWNDFMYKQSKHLIHQIVNSLNTNPYGEANPIKLVFINNDQFYAEN